MLKPMRILAPPSFLLFHEYYESHAFALSHSIMSPLPSDILYLILRLVPTGRYLRVYDEPIFGGVTLNDVETRYYPWCTDHRMFGDF